MQKELIILGAGRSGTSMLAGLFATAGYYMGEHLYAPRISNPKGFFESPLINGINERLLEQMIQYSCEPIKTREENLALLPGQRWLCRLDTPRYVEINGCTLDIAEATAKRPFCFKDPRFAYTLPYWISSLRDVVYLVIFRDPSVTAASMVTECIQAEYLKNVSMDYARALEIWKSSYANILRLHRQIGGVWCFVHYDQVLYGEVVEMLEGVSGVRVDREFPTETLKRTAPKPTSQLSGDIKALYRELCALAQYDRFISESA